MNLHHPAMFRLTCEQYGITVYQLAALFARGRTDNIRKWWKTQRPDAEAVAWVEGRVRAIDELAEKILATARAEHDEDPGAEPQLLTFRTNEAVAIFRSVDPDLNALQHRAATRIAGQQLSNEHIPYTVAFWEDEVGALS